MKQVVVLGDSSDTSSVRPDAVGRGCMVGRLLSGEYVLSGVAGGGVLNVYDARGKLRRTIGRKGAGPGEFRSPLRFVPGNGDSLFVVDDGNARIQVVTSTGDYVRVFPTRDRYRGFALLPDDQLVIFRVPSSRNDRLFHQFDREGNVLRSFGAPVQPDGSLDLENWFVVAAPRDRYWTASIWSYALSRWSGPDTLDLEIARKVDWFPSPSVYPEGMYVSVPPPPLLLHAWEDSSGRLWTYSAVADANWVPGKFQPSPEWQARTFDTMIEVIDLSSGDLLASLRYPTRLGMVCNSPLMYGVEELEDGDLRTIVLEPQLVHRQ
ncbi:MAG TPA: hypothetical protein VIK50_07045 [Gemmatimonadaceae bacterium]